MPLFPQSVIQTKNQHCQSRHQHMGGEKQPMTRHSQCIGLDYGTYRVSTISFLSNRIIHLELSQTLSDKSTSWAQLRILVISVQVTTGRYEVYDATHRQTWICSSFSLRHGMSNEVTAIYCISSFLHSTPSRDFPAEVSMDDRKTITEKGPHSHLKPLNVKGVVQAKTSEIKSLFSLCHSHFGNTSSLIPFVQHTKAYSLTCWIATVTSTYR